MTRIRMAVSKVRSAYSMVLSICLGFIKLTSKGSVRLINRGLFHKRMAFNRVSYKQTCILCKKNKVLITSWKQKPICTECGMKNFAPVTEEPYKTLFDIPHHLYTESGFLRSIRSNYHKYGSLSEKQIEVFRRVAKEIQEKKAAAPSSARPYGQEQAETQGSPYGSSDATPQRPTITSEEVIVHERHDVQMERLRNQMMTAQEKTDSPAATPAPTKRMPAKNSVKKKSTSPKKKTPASKAKKKQPVKNKHAKK